MSRFLPALVVIVHLAFGIAYQSTLPLFEAPDEPSHIHYMGFLAEQGRLPLYGDEPEVPGEGMQAPLYYALGAPLFAALVAEPGEMLGDLHRVSLSVYKIDTGAIARNRLIVRAPGVRPWGDPSLEQDPRLAGLLRLRWLSRLFGALAVLLGFLAARRLLGDEPLAVVATALLGLSPQFLFVSSYVSNDAAAACIGAGAMWLFARALDHPGRRRLDHLWLGLLAAVGLLTKTSTLPTLAVAGLAIFVSDARPLRQRLRDVLPGLALALLLLAPYLVWNTLNRGDPLGVTAMMRSGTELTQLEAYGGLVPYLKHVYWLWTFESYWARFGWMDLRAPTATYLACFALTWTGLLGVALTWRRGAGFPPHLVALRRYLLATCLASLAAHVWLNLQIPQPQGRHLFPSVAQAACLLALGLRQLVGATPTRMGWPAAGALIAILASLALYCWLGILVPVYAAD